MTNKGKWDAKTSALVHELCSRKDGVCIGLALLFFDPMASEEEMFNFVIELAGDPDNPMDPEEYKRLVACLEYIMIGVRKLYEDGIPEDRPEDAPVPMRCNLH